MKNITEKYLEWTKRYGIAELACTLSALLGGWICYLGTENRLFIAYVAAWSGNLGYYGTIFYREIGQSRKVCRDNGRLYNPPSFIIDIRNLLFEFGVAEVLDSFFFRPFCMYVFPIVFKDMIIGIVVANFVANITFYVPAILAYEVRKKYY